MSITLIPVAGLCNRMNAILSAIAVHQALGHEVKIYWENGSDCAAYFDELFAPIAGYPVQRLDPCHYWLLPPYGKKGRLASWLRRLCFDAQYLGPDHADSDDIIRDGRRRVYVYSGNRFCPMRIEEGLARYFQPTPALAQKVEAIATHYNDHTLGIHIRRTDNLRSIEDSPIELFLARIEREIAAHDDAKFYLATDDAEVKTQLKHRYGDRIITYDAALNRSSRQGMQDAIVELYCLARTRRILGSAASTYSETAARLYDIPLEILTTRPF